MRGFLPAALTAAVGLGLFSMGCASGSSTPPVAQRISSRAPLRAVSAGAASEAAELRVMSFNIRVRTFIDIFNPWSSRRDLLVRTVRDFDPDVLGTQEALAAQSDYLLEQLPEYGFVGAGRDDGKRRGEMCGIFYKKARFEKLDAGHFWLSENPSKPGSKGWDSSFTRVVTWIKLQPRDGSPAFCVFNTHFDVFGDRARRESSRLLLKQMNAIAPGMPTIITGDFNDEPGSAPYRALLAGGAGEPLIDVFRQANPAASRGEGTRHGFSGKTNGPRIDWIVTTSAFTPVESKILHTNRRGKFPSDHFPVTAILVPTTRMPVARIE